MARENNDGGVAFPHPAYDDPGMELRDFFAAQAIQGCAAAPFTDALLARLGSVEAVAEHVARAGYLIADAMLLERGKAG